MLRSLPSMSRALIVQTRRPVDFLLTGVVQSFMLLQVGFFDLLRRFRGWRLKRESLINGQTSSKAPREALHTISVIVPAFNEARSIGKCLDALERHASSLKRVQVVVVDAGCKDDTMGLVAAWASRTEASVLTTTSSGGRGPAVAAGARLSTGEAVLVLHADTALPANWDGAVLEALADPTVLMTAFSFGCDRAQLSCPERPPTGLALMEWTVNRRSRWYELPFGDQALATTRATLEAVGGYPETCILEEFILVNRLRAMSAAGLGRIRTLDATALCSPRRWERSTVWRINAVNQAVMLWHRWGATPAQVFEFYYGVPAPEPTHGAGDGGAECASGAGGERRLVGEPPSWDAISRCVNGVRRGAWATLFTERRVVFVHLPRTAGTSIEASLFGQDHFSQHHTAAELRALLGADAYEDAFRFTFVREPLDRYLSAFFYLLHRDGQRAGGPRGAQREISAHDTRTSDMLRRDFHSDPLAFLRHLQRLSEGSARGGAGGAGGWERAPLHFRPQAYYLPAEGLASLHFVGRFEALHADYARLLGHERLTQHSQPTLAHLRPAVEGGRPRLEWARSEELAALVREVYRQDYELLGYDSRPVKPTIGRASDTM